MKRSERWYRELLRLLPEDYRREAGPEILEVFREACCDAERSGGRLGRLRFWSSSLLDLVVTAIAAHSQQRGGLAQDVRVALRQMKSHPGWTSIVVLTLGLGIGANTALFSVFQSLLLKPLPVEDADRVVAATTLHGEDPVQSSAFDYLAWKSGMESFSTVGAAQPRSVNLLLNGEPRRLEGAAVTETYLPTLGVEPLFGRGFAEEDVRGDASPVVLLGYGLWQEAFGATPESSGRASSSTERPALSSGSCRGASTFLSALRSGSRCRSTDCPIESVSSATTSSTRGFEKESPFPRPMKS